MQRLEVSGAVRPIYGSLGVKRLKKKCKLFLFKTPTSHRAVNTFRIGYEKQFRLYRAKVVFVLR